jgi:hypothetical protein
MITCDCSIDIDERADFGSVEIRKARKSHYCCECGEEIKPGDKYEHASLFSDGMFSRYKTCIPCQRIRDTYCPHGYCYEMLIDTIKDCLGFDYTEEPDDIEIDPEDEEAHAAEYRRKLSKKAEGGE